MHFTGKLDNKWLPLLLSWIIPLLVFLVVWNYLMTRMGKTAGGFMEVGKSKFSEETAREIDIEIRRIIENAFKKAVSIIDTQRERLEQGAQLLLQKETLGEEDLTNLIHMAHSIYQPCLIIN